METIQTFEKYPCKNVVISNALSFAIYLTGTYIFLQFGVAWAIAFLTYCLFLEVRIIKSHCVDCYYYGKTCAFGKGRASSLFFKKGDPAKFNAKQPSWKSMIPDMLLLLLPLIAGIALLVTSFDLVILALILLIIFLATAGNSYVRGQLACKFCKQRELGCPAEKLFNKDRK